jgi:DNA-3-methyladenine glycosylase I
MILSGEYHHNDRLHFEMLCLEGAQAGLSWETVLKKRSNYKKLFADFDPVKVSKFTDEKLEKILLDPGIIRNRLKVFSVRQNAIAFLKIQKEYKSFDKYIWGFVNHKSIKNKRKNLKEVPTNTKESDLISSDLKKRGMKFIGSTIIYAYMQAVGLVNDHITSCFKY